MGAKNRLRSPRKSVPKISNRRQKSSAKIAFARRKIGILKATSGAKMCAYLAQFAYAFACFCAHFSRRRLPKLHTRAPYSIGREAVSPRSWISRLDIDGPVSAARPSVFWLPRSAVYCLDSSSPRLQPPGLACPVYISPGRRVRASSRPIPRRRVRSSRLRLSGGQENVVDATEACPSPTSHN